MFRSFCLSFLLTLGLAGVLACAGQSFPAEDAAVGTRSPALPTSRPADAADRPGSPDFDELVRQREAALQTMAVVPTLTPTPTPDYSALASEQVLAGQAPVSPEAALAPLPEDGVWWYRTASGDWSRQQTKENNPYTPLFYAVSQEPQHASFNNGRLQRQVADLMAAEVEILLPELAGNSAGIIHSLVRNFGWEMAGDDLPAARVWSSFLYHHPLYSDQLRYRVGGVMLFEVLNYTEPGTGDLIYQYLGVGNFIGKGVLLENEGPITGR